MNKPWGLDESLKLLPFYRRLKEDKNYSIYKLIRDYKKRYPYYGRTLESIRSKLWRIRVKESLMDFDEMEIDVELPEFIELVDSTESTEHWLWTPKEK